MEEMIKNGDVEGLEHLLQADPALLSQNPTALHTAVNESKVEVVKCLLKHGAEINHLSPINTPLYLACRNGHLELVQLLIESGANLHQPLRFSSIFHAACFDKHLDVAKLLLEHGVDVDIPDWCGGATALHLNSYYGHVEVIQFLIENGANIDSLEPNGDTPLLTTSRVVVAEEIQAAMRLLVESGADMDVQDYRGNTALMNVCRLGAATMALFLLGKGANVKLVNKKGKTALNIAKQHCFRFGVWSTIDFVMNNEFSQMLQSELDLPSTIVVELFRRKVRSLELSKKKLTEADVDELLNKHFGQLISAEHRIKVKERLLGEDGGVKRESLSKRLSRTFAPMLGKK